MTSTQAFYALALLVTFGFSSSCSSTSDQKSTDLDYAERIVIDGTKVEKEMEIGDWIEEIRVFPLEEVEGSMLGDVDKVLLTDKHLIVFDKVDTRKIVVYSRNGHFLKELDLIGDGPFPVNWITDCWLNNEGNLEVYDSYAARVLTFNHELDIQYATTIPDGFGFNRMINNPGSTGYVGFAGYNGSNGKPIKLAVLDSNLTVQKTMFPFEPELMGAGINVPMNPLFRMGDTLRFYQNFDPRIYTVHLNGNLEVRYFLDYVHQPLQEDFERELILKNLEAFVGEESTYKEQNGVFHGYTGFRGQWMESKDYAVFSSFDTDHDGFNSIYHKGKKQIVAQGRDLREDERYQLVVPTHFQAADTEDNRFVIVLPGYWLAEYLAPGSPFYEQVNQDPETMFAMEVVMK